MKIGFDNNKYLKLQSEKIKERLGLFEGKLYLEFGGKLFDDYHAERVLPGFLNDSKLRLLEELKEDSEVVFCINADHIERNKIRADYGISYSMDVLRLIDALRERGINVNSVVITLYNGQQSAFKFQKKLELRNIKTYFHTFTKGYPTDVDTIVSEEGYGANPYIETTKDIVIITAPGPCSGKLATCLSQLYHEQKKGMKSGYAKFETFPVWNLPLKHPVNIAYEAATADLKDINMIDSFHLDAYGESSVNYNRDLQVFPVLKTILDRIMGKSIYKSPTDMGVNMIGSCITDDEVIKEASKQEVIRRYYKATCDYKLGQVDKDVPERIKMLMNELEVNEDNRPVIKTALERKEIKQAHIASLMLEDGTIISGKESELLSAPASMLINCIKEITQIPDDVHLLSPNVLEPILKLKPLKTSRTTASLNLQEVLIALSICTTTNPLVTKALANLSKLEGCEVHATYMLSSTDLNIFRNLKINVTMEDEFHSDKLYND